MKTVTTFIFVIFVSLVFLLVPSTSQAKFTCKVKSIDKNKLTLINCQEKGLSKLSPGDTVSITKKRKKSGKKGKKKKKKVEGC